MLEPISLDHGTMAFTVEGRILRELGERLVRQPEVALLELIKNSYDADAKSCSVKLEPSAITVLDDGFGMTLENFRDGWMKVGTALKSKGEYSLRFMRPITGEKGIGRFAVRFLGQELRLVSVAFDQARSAKTRLVADFDWPRLDELELAEMKVPYRLEKVGDAEPIGTELRITKLRPSVLDLNIRAVRSSSLSVVSPLRSLVSRVDPKGVDSHDPGFSIEILGGSQDNEDSGDLALRVLNNFVLRSTLRLRAGKLQLEVFRRGEVKPVVSIVQEYESDMGPLTADIRFFPRRSGSFSGLGLDGRVAYSWVKENAGVAVFDRGFRVSPYGSGNDDWLSLQSDTSVNAREPRSSLSLRNFEMTPSERVSTAENWMLRLPGSQQLVGVVEVEGARSTLAGDGGGLVAAADREGFISNDSFRDLVDLVRGAVEAIAYQDRQDQLESERKNAIEARERLDRETEEALEEISADDRIPAAVKRRIVNRIVATSEAAKRTDDLASERVRQLRVMSLMGVVAGFMTHEFGAAVDELESAAKAIESSPIGQEQSVKAARVVRGHKKNLEEYVRYTTAYIRGSAAEVPDKSYPVLPRVRHVVKTFGKYAMDRDIEILMEVDRDLMAPRVPVSMYNGVALNLFSNALKAVTAADGAGAPARVAFRSWNTKTNHVLEVSDTGIGIPRVLRERVFDPLFTTTASRDDPLGSGMGLGLSLVRQVVTAFGGTVQVVDPPPGYATTVQVKLPAAEE